MKKNICLSFLLGFFCVIVIGAVLRQDTGVYIIDSPAHEIKLKMRSIAQTANWIEASNDGTNVFTVTANGGIVAPGIQSGVVATGNTFLKTNTFTTSYSAAPVVTLTGPTNSFPHIVSISTSNFVLGAAITNATFQYIAIGLP